MPNYAERIARGEREWGAEWSARDLEAAAPEIRRAYETGERIKVRREYPDGYVWERTGTVGTTSGWVPAFILMTRSNAHGSSDVLGPHDRVVAHKVGREYVAVA